MAQEKARLDYLAARETYACSARSDAFGLMQERLLQLQSTSAIVQALLNEHYLEQLLTPLPLGAGEGRVRGSGRELSIGKSR
jgi:hypothetical protein